MNSGSLYQQMVFFWRAAEVFGMLAKNISAGGSLTSSLAAKAAKKYHGVVQKVLRRLRRQKAYKKACGLSFGGLRRQMKARRLYIYP